MALNWLWKNVMGEATISYNDYDKDGNITGKKSYKVKIYAGNCLAIFIYHYVDNGVKYYSLSQFFHDADHLRRYLKSSNGQLFDRSEVKSIKLNTFFAESVTMMKILTKHAGLKVTCYYKEITKL